MKYNEMNKKNVFTKFIKIKICDEMKTKNKK